MSHWIRQLPWYIAKAAGPAAIEMNAEPGSYAITGASITEFRAVEINAEPGSYTITGASITEFRNVPINAEPGSYVITGFDATTIAPVTMNAEPGAYAITGFDITTLRGRVLAGGAEPGSYVLTGFDATTLVTAPIVMIADPGSYTIVGADIYSGTTASESAQIVTGGRSVFRYPSARLFGILFSVPTPYPARIHVVRLEQPIPVNASRIVLRTQFGLGMVSAMRTIVPDAPRTIHGGALRLSTALGLGYARDVVFRPFIPYTNVRALRLSVPSNDPLDWLLDE